MQTYKTISSENVAELIIKKSKFIVISTPISTKEQVEDILDKLKKEHPHARTYAMPIL